MKLLRVRAVYQPHTVEGVNNAERKDVQEEKGGSWGGT